MAAIRSGNDGHRRSILEIGASDRSRVREAGRYRTICISDLGNLGGADFGNGNEELTLRWQVRASKMMG